MYKMTLKIAWLNLWRRARRSMMVILMIVFSLAGLLSLQGLYEGMYQQMIDNTVRSDSGEVSLYAPGYRLSKSLDERMDSTEKVTSAIAQMPQVRAYTLRLQQEGLIATARKSQGVMLIGIDADSERRFGQLDSYITEGAYGFGEEGSEVMLGSELARKMALDIGSRVIFSVQNAEGDIGSVSLKVGGIFKTNNMHLDQRSAFADLSSMRELVGVKTGATQIAISLHNRSDIAAVQQQLKTELEGLEVMNWEELYPLLVQMQEMVGMFNSISYLIVFVVAALGIFGVMLVSVLERLREFGIMLAIGTPYAVVRNQVIVEAAMLGVLGYLGGCIVGGSILWVWHLHGLDLSALSAGMESFGLNAVVIAEVKASYFGEAFLSVFFASALSVVWPLRVLKKLHPVDVIREN